MTDSSTDRQWEQWAVRNPYFGVLGVESSGMGDGPARDRFFQTGRDHLAAILARLRDRGWTPPAGAAALDFGCGVGRILLPLGEAFARVVGVDVSPTMLKLARENLQGRTNIDLLGSLPAAAAAQPGGFDFVHSYLVLQHVRPAQGYPLLRQLFAAVRPGGAFAVHFTVGDRRPLRRILNAFRYRLPPLQWMYNLARRRPWNEPVAEMNAYDFATVLDLLLQAGCRTSEIQALDHHRHLGVMVTGIRPG
jgi:SAM-dependent methyltransferase